MFSIIIISGTGAILAALLVFAHRVIANYGDVEIDINGGTKKITIKGGGTLLDALGAQKIFIPSACGGRGTCAYCKLRVLEGGGDLLPTEEPYMNEQERASQVRLSCQVKVRNSLKIEIPAELFAIKEYTCVCEKIIDRTYDTKQFNLRLTDPTTIDYIAGQYVQVLAPAYEGSPEEVYRAYSISSDPADKSNIELIVRRVPGGICTTYLFDHLKQGDKAKINGPYGQFYVRETNSPIIFVAGGSGIAPIKAMLHHMKNTKNPRPAILFFGVGTTEDLYLVDEIEKIRQALPNFKFIPTVSQPEPDSHWQGAVGRVTEVAGKYLMTQPNAKDYECYLCGSPGMVDSALKVTTEIGIPIEKNYYDKF